MNPGEAEHQPTRQPASHAAPLQPDRAVNTQRWQPPSPDLVLETATALTIPPRIQLEDSIRAIHAELDRVEHAARALRGRDGHTELMDAIGVMNRYLGAVEHARQGVERCSAHLQQAVHRVLADSPDTATYLHHKQALELSRIRHDQGGNDTRDPTRIAATAFPVRAGRALRSGTPEHSKPERVVNAPGRSRPARRGPIAAAAPSPASARGD